LDKKLNSYKGKLSPQQTAEGINAAKRNSHRLARDAELLCNAGRYPSAASLARLSIEESGKVSLLRQLALARNEAELAKSWKEYRSHTNKNITWLMPELFVKGARRLEDFRALFDKASNHPYVLDQLKQIGFYTDCLGKAHWSIPENHIDASIAKGLVQIADILSKPQNEVTVLEIELWIKHLKPVWKTNMTDMKAALIDWDRDMVKHGLSEKSADDMEKFINTGLFQ
jgi:AbiV family abortive infection protein